MTSSLCRTDEGFGSVEESEVVFVESNAPPGLVETSLVVSEISLTDCNADETVAAKAEVLVIREEEGRVSEVVRDKPVALPEPTEFVEELSLSEE